MEGALEAAHKIGYPVLVRAAFTLGGLGSGFAENDAELKDLAVRALEGGSSTTKQILIDQDLRGWKEVESATAERRRRPSRDRHVCRRRENDRRLSVLREDARVFSYAVPEGRLGVAR